MDCNPILVEVTRGNIVESFHHVSYAIVDNTGVLLACKGEISRPVFPRSSIKAFQALPLIATGTAKAFGYTNSEIALACSSHSGEKVHIETARSMLKKAKIDEENLACGAHWPISETATQNMVANREKPACIHNTCSGKHAGMLATAKYLGEPLADYIDKTHPVQERIQSILSKFCDYNLTRTPCGIDGCNVPTWAIPLEKLALAFARFAAPAENLAKWTRASETIIEAVRSIPLMVSGTDRFPTKIMQSVPRLFVKDGAEGVYCGSIPHAGIGIALKCHDGASRAAETAFAKILSNLEVWRTEEKTALSIFSRTELKNRQKITVGEIRVF